MARIRRFLVGKQTVGVHPSEVDCFHQLVPEVDGLRLLHLSTFGSGERSAPKSSQSIQIDETRARELLAILANTFPSLGLSSERGQGGAAVAGKAVLQSWLVEALASLGGSATVVDICREIWHLHREDLEVSGDLAFTWQYDIRWAAKVLRDEGILVSAAEQIDREWRLSTRP